MPFYFLEAIDSDGFIRTRIVQNLSKPIMKDLIDWLGICSPEEFKWKIE